MINLETGKMVVGNQEDQLVGWAVWFVTAEGTHTTLEEALQSCAKTGQPTWSIKPMPVALGTKMFEVMGW